MVHTTYTKSRLDYGKITLLCTANLLLTLTKAHRAQATGESDRGPDFPTSFEGEQQ